MSVLDSTLEPLGQFPASGDLSWLQKCSANSGLLSRTLDFVCCHDVWYSEHGMYCRFEIILEQAMSATHVAVILRMRTSPAYEEEFTKMDYPDARNEYGTS